MQFLHGKSNIDFMSLRKPALSFSLGLILLSIGSLFVNGLNLGIDFTGGYLIEAGYKTDIELSTLRDALNKNSFEDAQVQHFGTTKDVLVRIPQREGGFSVEISNEVLHILESTSKDPIAMRRIETVGPQIGDELRDQGGIALLTALFGILIYVSFRFQFKSAVGAIIALIHDIIITVGCFSILQIDFDLSVLAALLAVIGYSLNDTVVVLDRIRETFRNVRKKSSVEILNLSINQTLSRTLMTSLTTLLVLTSLFLLGGEVIHGFALALIIGVIIGTYSSIYVASSTLVAMNINKQDFLTATKEEIVDDRP